MAFAHLPAQGTGIRSLGPGIEYSLLSAIFDFFPEGLAFLDPNLVIRAANGVFSRQIRHRLDEIVDRSAEAVIPGATAQVGKIFRRVREAGKPWHGAASPFEFEDQPERGTTYWEYTVCPVYEPDHEFAGYLLTNREVTGQVQAGQECEEALQPAHR